MSSWSKHNPNNPFECCYKCAARRLGCHDKCEADREAKKIRAEQKRKGDLEEDLQYADRCRALRYARKGS